MLGVVTLTLFFLSLISLAVAVIAIRWLSIVSKHLSALGKRVLESDDIGKITQAADKITSYESRMTGCESKADKTQNHLVGLETKVNKLATKLESVEQMVRNNGADLTESIRSIKALTDKIEILQNFQTAIEKTHNIIQAALNDMRVNMPPEENHGMKSGIVEPEDTLHGAKDKHEESEDLKTSGTFRFEL